MTSTIDSSNTIIEYIDLSRIKKKYKRIQDDRQQETLNILAQLKKVEYPKESQAIRELIKICNVYIYNSSQSIKFLIPFPEINKKIIGILSNDKREKCVVLLRELSNSNNEV